jgi:hypothetical protein
VRIAEVLESIYQVHRGTSRAIQFGVRMADDLQGSTPAFIVSIWAEPDPVLSSFQ